MASRPDAQRYQVSFSSTDDADLDGELIDVEDTRRILDVIVATCRRYGLQARVSVDGRTVVAEVEPSGAVSWR